MRERERDMLDIKVSDLRENAESELRTRLEQFVGRPNTKEVHAEIASAVSDYIKAIIEEYIPPNHFKMKEGEIERITNLLEKERDNGKD